VRVTCRCLIGRILLVAGLIASATVAATQQRERAARVNDAQYEKLMIALQPCVDRARATFPSARNRFAKGLPPDQQFFITVRLSAPKQKEEQAFVEVISIRPGTIHGKIASPIHTVKDRKIGDAIDVAERDVVDWTISHSDGTEEGNLLGRFLDRHGNDAATPKCDPDNL